MHPGFCCKWIKQTYDYCYDHLNKAKSAVSIGSASKDNLYGENVTYDNMGNITNLGRYDKIGTTKTQIDTLTYTYSHYKVTQVDDASAYAGTAGFQDPIKTANEYAYDGNGNELKDLNKGISSISYNMLNLPQTITKSDGSTVTYVYSASGNKLRKILVAAGITTTTEYENGIEYDNSTSTIAFIQTEEGRARKSGSTYVYEYDLKDHLGNTRVTLTPDPNDATQQTAKLLQQNDYYAFGYGIQSTQQTISPKNEYLYNHKELQEETGLYDYGARFYDPVIARWGGVDPLAEKYRRWSTYIYGMDDPIRFIDPDGMRVDLGQNTIEKRKLNKEEISLILRGLQNITDDKLRYNEKSGLIEIESKGKGKRSQGTSLIRELIGNKHTLTLNYSRSVQNGRNVEVAGASTDATNNDEVNTRNGRGTDMSISIGKGFARDVDAGDGKNRTSLMSVTDMLDHELIHGLAGMNGDQLGWGTMTRFWQTANGTQQGEVIQKEENATSFQGKAPSKNGYNYPTENMLRKEQSKLTFLNYDPLQKKQPSLYHSGLYYSTDFGLQDNK